MPITINGTIVTTNSVNETSIGIETVNGNPVYGGTVSRVWYTYGRQSSEPSEYTPYTEISNQLSTPTSIQVAAIMTSTYPPANIPVGTIGWVYYTNLGEYYMLMVIEE